MNSGGSGEKEHRGEGAGAEFAGSPPHEGAGSWPAEPRLSQGVGALRPKPGQNRRGRGRGASRLRMVSDC